MGTPNDNKKLTILIQISFSSGEDYFNLQSFGIVIYWLKIFLRDFFHFYMEAYHQIVGGSRRGGWVLQKYNPFFSYWKMKKKITAAGDVLKSIFDLIVYLRKSNPKTIGSWRKIVKTNHRSLLSDITTKLNEGRPDPVSIRTIQYNSHKYNYRRSVVKKKLVIKDVNH